MRHYFLFICIVLGSLFASAQSDYISYSPISEEDRIGDLNGNGGILILSKRSDLVVTVTNARDYSVTPKGMGTSGLYEYEVVINKDETNEPKIEVNRRGDVYRTDFVAKTRADFFRAYLIEEVQRPIRMEDQSLPNDAILNAELAEVEITSTIQDLQINCPEALDAKISTKRKTTDENIIITSVVIPIKKLEAAKKHLQTTSQAYKELHSKLVDDPKGSEKATDADWTRLDQLEEQASDAERQLSELSRIYIFAKGTNKLPIDISNLGPRSKVSYGVLLLKTVVKEHVSVCSGFLEEGGRLFELREYESAKKAFTNALNASDTPQDLKATIRTNMAQCDTCMSYERYTLGALAKIREMKKNGGSQEDLYNYATAGIEYLQKLYRYNPLNFYSGRINQLQELINDQPLEVGITFTKWMNNNEGLYETGVIPNVEVWAVYGTIPTPNSYKNDKKFNDLVGKSNDYKQIGISGKDGVADLQFDRTTLPKGLLFRPVGYGDKIKPQYLEMGDMIEKSQGTYNKRRFRVRMYVTY